MRQILTMSAFMIVALTTVTALFFTGSFPQTAECFVLMPSSRRSSISAASTAGPRRPSSFRMVAGSGGESLKRRNIKLPLLDVSEDVSEYTNKIVTPLPSAHLPDELRTLNLYGMELDRPVHKIMMEEIVTTKGGVGEAGDERVYGHIVWKPEDGSLVGAIGCTAEVLVSAPSSSTSATDDEDGAVVTSAVDEDARTTVLCRGSYRFIVKEVLKTFPYPVAIVDELSDEPPLAISTASTDDTQDDKEEEVDDDDDDDLYADLDASELVGRTLTAMHAFVKEKQSGSSVSELSPLQKSILEKSGVPVATESSQKTQAEEMAAVLDVFQSSLIDIVPMPVDRYYAIAMMAAEMASVDNDIRRQIVSMQDGVQRLRVVLAQLENTVGMSRARKMANAITNDSDEDNQELKVGAPELPPWAKQLKEGTRLEYFWSEVDGWCGGVVAEDPIHVVDELIVTVRFDDGETHRLPFRAEEKVRWRPAMPSTE